MLTDNAFFSGVEAASLIQILPAFRLTTFPAHTRLYRRGRIAREVFLVVSGSVYTSVALLGPGEFTGEWALLEPPGRNPWSAVCREETCVAVAAGDALLAVLTTQPHLGFNVAHGLYRRVCDAAAVVDGLVAGR